MDTLIQSVILIITRAETGIEYARINYPTLEACIEKATYFMTAPNGAIFIYECQVTFITGTLL